MSGKLALFDFLVFFFGGFFSFFGFPCFFEAFFLSFPRILGVPQREKPLLFGGLLAFFFFSFFATKRAGVGGSGLLIFLIPLESFNLA